MQIICQNPLNAICRISDVARRLDIELSHISMIRRSDGTAMLSLALFEPDLAAANVFAARVRNLPDLVAEPTHV